MVKKKSGRGGRREGAGRKVGSDGPAVIVTASVPGSLVARLDALAEAEGWNRSRAITEAIRAVLARKKSRRN